MKKLVYKESIQLKKCSDINEKMIQELISQNPSCLGLGKLELVNREVKQKSGGFLDILLEENEEIRYEVEIQLGATNPDHIIRTIEYWNNEKRRSPEMSHIPVIVAEEITGRFMDVISLFNKAIPIIAIQMSVFKDTNDDFGIIFTKILDLSDPDDEEEIAGDFTREDWEKKSTKDNVQLTERIYNDIVENKDEYKLNFVQHYIGITQNGSANNFISFVPKKRFVKIRFKATEDEKTENMFKNKGFEITYCSRLGRKDYCVRVKDFGDYLKIKEELSEMIKDKV